MRTTVNDAMDVHGGKAIVDGPLNYLGNLHRAVPIGITVEGANILTRSLIIFGQGALRAHPYLLRELQAMRQPDARVALLEFDRALGGHVRHLLKTLARAWLRSWSGGLLAPGPGPHASGNSRAFRRLGRYAAALAFTSEIALLALGGSLKRRESISARLGDILSELYLLSAVLKRHHDERRPSDDAPLVQWCCESGYARIESALAGVIANFPMRPLAWAIRVITLPFGVRSCGPSDATTRACAELLLQRGAARDRLTPGVFAGCEGNAITRLEHAFDLAHRVAPLRRRLRDAGFGDDGEAAVAAGVIGEQELALLDEARNAMLAVIAVDSFTPAELLSFAPIRRHAVEGSGSRPRALSEQEEQCELPM
jgi:acyl-CoA dehydrogenase